MDRLDHVDENRLHALRTELASELPEHELQNDPLDRRDRTVVAYYQEIGTGEWIPSALKRDDDVFIGGLVMRVIGPAPSRGRFYAYRQDDKHGELVIPFEVTRVENRAPKNQSETAMPVVPGFYEPPPPEDLEALRQDAFAKIDARSQELIKAGFTYRDVVFSASLEAQARYNGMMTFVDALTYPLGINSLDDTVNLNLIDQDDVRGFCLTALGHIKAVVDSGSTQKQRVRDMTEPAQLREYQDPR